MAKKTTATVARTSKPGQFTLRQEGATEQVVTAQPKTAKTVAGALLKNRDALKRLANR